VVSYLKENTRTATNEFQITRVKEETI